VRPVLTELQRSGLGEVGGNAPAAPAREFERLFWRSERYNRLVLSGRDRFRQSVRNYRRLYEACRTGDPEEAEHAIEEQMRWAVDLVGDSLPSEVE
jgi:DNA-binding GntR family transcriptional regulator